MEGWFRAIWQESVIVGEEKRETADIDLQCQLYICSDEKEGPAL